MNYITSCPKCETQFLLTDEDIKAYRGKVRCGNCEHVFNAKNRVTEVPENVSNPEEYQASVEQADQEIEETISQEAIEAEKVVNVEEAGSITVQPEVDEPIQEAQLPAVVEYTVVEEPEFLQQKIKVKRSKTWPAILSLLLLILICLQTIYYMRTEIAAYYPQFKPLLVKACKQLNCKVNLPKNLSLITIGDSDMQEDESYESVIKFESTVINTARYAQAYPNIKLTLTNTKDRAVIEKIFAPKQYLDKGTIIANGIAARQEIRIKLSLLVTEAAVAGYRIQLAY